MFIPIVVFGEFGGEVENETAGWAGSVVCVAVCCCKSLGVWLLIIGFIEFWLDSWEAEDGCEEVKDDERTFVVWEFRVNGEDDGHWLFNEVNWGVLLEVERLDRVECVGVFEVNTLSGIWGTSDPKPKYL